MKLKDCIHGKLIIDDQNRIGMIVGITNNYFSNREYEPKQNSPENAVPLVQWANGATSGVHYSRLELFEEF